jgi:glucose-6-phosphate 1-dehydrogenase
MIDRLAIFGATGDLTARFLLPALGTLCAHGDLPEGFQLTCASREEWTTAQYRQWAADQLDRHCADLPKPARDALVAATRYLRVDVSNPVDVAAALPQDRPVAAYLALPPFLFPSTVTALRRAGLGRDSRIVLEKPFGEDLSSAVHLNQLLADLLPEQAIFRIDHFLAMTTVQNLLGSRLANRILEPVWNSSNIAKVEIVWEEALALEGRAAYYDGVGALKDMVQNHLLQIMCLVAMEPPLSLGEADLRDRKRDVLRSVRRLSPADMLGRTRRASYTAGRVDGNEIPAYVDEQGVQPDRHTETFAEVNLEIENWRWAGAVFQLRTGKAFARDRKEVALHLRPVPHLPFGDDSDAPPNVLRFGLEPEHTAIDLVGIGPHTHTLAPISLRAQAEPAALPAYGRLLLDVLNGDPTLSIRDDEAELAWQVLTPVIEAWSSDAVPMEEYPAGSTGPRARSLDAHRELHSLDLGVG